MKHEITTRHAYLVPQLTVVQFAAERGYSTSPLTMVGPSNFNSETDNTPDNRTWTGGDYIF